MLRACPVLRRWRFENGCRKQRWIIWAFSFVGIHLRNSDLMAFGKMYVCMYRLEAVERVSGVDEITVGSFLKGFMGCDMHVCSVTQSCSTLCDPVDWSSPGSSVHGILQARILEWVAVPSSRGSSWPRDRTRICYLPHWQAGSSTTIGETGKCKYSGNFLSDRSSICRKADLDTCASWRALPACSWPVELRVLRKSHEIPDYAVWIQGIAAYNCSGTWKGLLRHRVSLSKWNGSI